MQTLKLILLFPPTSMSFNKRMNPLVYILQVLINHPPQLFQILFLHILQLISSKILEHDLNQLLPMILLLQFLKSFSGFFNPLVKKSLLVHHSIGGQGLVLGEQATSCDC
ncbi:hypothetical protein V6N11_057065 [Hibiscus sabdariffa]|uniref:Uncharacterized protein n=1 Tax=Hibiscus sabdariffa TaxID=183260 RepID=A0ABR1ZW40_9ROSI